MQRIRVAEAVVVDCIVFTLKEQKRGVVYGQINRKPYKASMSNLPRKM